MRRPALRFMVPLLTAVLLAGTVFVASTADARQAGCETTEVAGTRTETITVGGVRRTYLLVVPASTPSRMPLPVVLALHGGSDTAENAKRYMGLTGSAPALYVYPQAPYWPEAGGVGWNVDPAGVDFPYFDALMADLKSKHCVDTRRVFATGKSNGAFMVNALACHRPGLLRAIAPVAGGGPSTSNCPSGPGVAAMIVHGSADQVVPIRSAQWSLEYWLWRNGYRTGSPVPTQPTPCVSYPGTAQAVLWCQHGGAHTWPSWAGAGVTRFFVTR